VSRRIQSGMTLVIALVMLIVLTLLVVSAIRFGNISLKIAGNAQTEAEAFAAAQVAVETTVAAIAASPNIATITAQPNLAVSTGAVTYTASVTAPSCAYSKPVSTDTLDPGKAADQVCFEGGDQDKLVTAGGTLTVTPSACKDQQWEVTASVKDDNSGANVAILQGAAVRVGAHVNCP
jgi:Tfp pilus assembly protein PilX